MTEQIPAYWKTKLQDVAEQLTQVSSGTVRLLSKSAGGRDIHVVEFGHKQELSRTANYNSACGARNPSYYAQKDQDTKPILLIIGGIHGGEFEGIAAVINLLHIIETGKDYRGKSWPYIHEHYKQFRLLIIPCMNPDGRARLSFDTMVGKDKNELKYYVQGTWKDGTLCDWPACKAVHPIKEHVDVLGGYFNDNGINLMHDNFFMPMAEETRNLLKLVDNEAPDFTVGLHGGADCINMFIPANYASAQTNAKTDQFDQLLFDACIKSKVRYKHSPVKNNNGTLASTPSFNLSSAIHHVCGGISITYESNMGLDVSKGSYGPNPEGASYAYDELLDSHLVLFESMLKFYERAE